MKRYLILKVSSTFDFNITAKFIHFIRKERGWEACFPLNVLSEISELQSGDKIFGHELDDKTPMTVICPRMRIDRLVLPESPGGSLESGSWSGIRAEISRSLFSDCVCSMLARHGPLEEPL